MIPQSFVEDPGAKDEPKHRSLSDDEIRRAVRKKTAAKPILYQRDLPRIAPAPITSPDDSEDRVDIAELQGREHQHPGGGKALIVATASRAHKVLHYVSREFHARFHDPASGLSHRLASCGIVDLTPEQIIFMDIETTGLGASPLFLVGILQWEKAGFTVSQFLARDYSEENAVLACFLDRLPSSTLLVTFNGKSFDVPYLRMRAAVHGLKAGEFPRHIDLLHESRRVWKKDLPDCKLQTLERHICRRVRNDDIPGQEIAQAYHDFVRTQNAGKIKKILKHNLLDLATLADLLSRLPKP